MKYFVNYGLNNSDITEVKHFKLYRDAKKFYETLDSKYQAKVCYKAKYNEDGSICKKEPKLYSFERGVDNTKMIHKYIIMKNN